MSGQSSGQTPRTSSSSRLSAPSTQDDESPLVNGSPTSGFSGDLNNHPNGNVTVGKGPRADFIQDEHQQRRHKPRSSGGFLLPSDNPQSRLASFTERTPSETMKGKRKVEGGDLIVPKRPSILQRHKQKPSLGSSPLATEVSNVRSAEQIDGEKSNRLGAVRPHPKQNIRSRLSSLEKPTASIGEAQEQQISTAGQDTDPAQIINLALTLSESRRRNFSSGGLLSPRDQIGARRLVSSGQPPLRLPSSAAGGSLRQHLNQQRQISRNVSPKSGRSASGKGASPRLSQQEQGEPRRSSALPDFGAGLTGDVYDASDATLARAEKARVALELSYEYRRLLQWLPKLPTTATSRPTTSKDGNKSRVFYAEGLGRTYNPLQYVRNRKVRFNEKRPLDSEAQGWIDVASVRTWVDTVVDEREDGLSRIDQRFPLPPFDPSHRGLAISDGIQSPALSNAPTSQSRKIARPHTVWEFSPWDLLADAYWVHQDDNLMHIEDSHGKKLVTKIRNHQEDPSRKSMDSTKGLGRRSESKVRRHGSPDKLRGSIESLRSDSKERGRRRWDIQKPRSPASDDDGSQTRRSRFTRRFVRSRSSSTSEVDSARDKRRRHIRSLSHLSSRDDYDSAALEKHMMDMLAKEAEDSDDAGRKTNGQTIEGIVSGQRQSSSDTPNVPATQTTRRRPSAIQRFRTDMPSTQKHDLIARASLDEQQFQHHRMSSDDLDSTAPNSPTAPGFVPSIAINLSPPASPRTSAVSPKKMLPSRVGSFRRARSPNVSKRAVSELDFALESGTSTDVSRQVTNESHYGNTIRKELSKDPSNGLLSPIKSQALGKGSRPPGHSSNQSHKESNTSESRIRGLFKGGRIAELVGNEVSKVGDMFWRKDGGNTSSQINSPVVSDYPSEDSDTDDGDVSVLDKPPENNLSRVVSNTSGKDQLSRTSTNQEKPKYYMNNLPSFRSPFHKDEPTLKSSKATQDHDHISRQQVALRERGRSSRFDRLAPPKIDMRGVSPSPSRASSPERTDSRVTYDQDSRQSSSSRSGHRLRSADRRLNAMLDVPGRVGSGGLSPTGLAALASRKPGSRERPTLEEKRQWSISDRGVSAVRGTISKRDIARVRALLLSSGVKANEIVRRAENVPSTPSPFLQRFYPLIQGPLPCLPRYHEYIVAGRALVSNIEANTQHLRDGAEGFSHSAVEDLHDQIKAINDHVNYQLTPHVRTAADGADAFSTELTTTHTLSVKQLNDSIDVILRRRRRRLRWIRRGGWAMLEWTLLGVMWIVWFVVVIIRLVRGTISGFIEGLRWFFWL